MTPGKLPLGSMSFAGACFLALAIVLAYNEFHKQVDRAEARWDGKATASTKWQAKLASFSDSSAFRPARFRSIAGRYEWAPRDYFTDDALIRACEVIFDGDTDALKLLIENGLDVNGQGVGGLTLLHWAFACEDLQCFRVLLEAGADPDVPLSKGLKSRDEVVFYTRDTILQTCARRDGWWHYLIAGLKHCQRPDLIGAGDDKLTNLITNSRGNATALRAVLEAGANPNFEDSGQSGFVKALIGEDDEAVAVLLDHHADPLWGDISTDEMLQLIQKRIVRYSAERGDPEFAVLSRLRDAVTKRAEQQK